MLIIISYTTLQHTASPPPDRHEPIPAITVHTTEPSLNVHKRCFNWENSPQEVFNKGSNEFAATPTDTGSCIEFDHQRKNKWGDLDSCGMYKRQMTGQIKNFVMVGEIDKALGNVEKLGGKIVMQKMEIQGIGLAAIIQDTEGNVIGLWKPEML